MRYPSVLLFLGILASPLIALPAQAVTTPNAGQRIRVTARSLFPRRVQGVIEAKRGDTLLLRDARNRSDTALRRVSLRAIERLEVRQHRSRLSGVLRGFTIGLLAGAATGAVIGATIDPGTDSTPEANTVILGGSGAGAGAIIGTVIGALAPGRRWVEWPLPARATFFPRGSSGVTLTALIPF